jgi:ribose transport system permease protein
MVVVLVLAGLLLHRTILGRRIYAVGGNPEAAKLSGVPVEGVRFFTFALMGTVAGLAGVLQASRVAFGEAEAGGLTLLFEVFAIVIVGGTSLSGGEGAMWRTAVGVAILAMIGNAFVLLNLSAVYQQVFFGAIILAAVAIDAWGRVNTTR